MEWKRHAITENNSVTIPERWLFIHYYEALNILFRIENALRVFVFIVLKNEFKDKWADIQVSTEGESEGTLLSIAKRRMGQSQSFGYLGYNIACPVMHLTSGEITRLITSDAYWKHFKCHFLGSKEIIRSKFDEIGNVRNSLAHFRPIRQDDIDVIRQNSKHVFLGIEKMLVKALTHPDVTPTNTSDDWYLNLRTLGTDQCNFTFRQSSNGDWIKIQLKFGCPIINAIKSWKYYYRYVVTTINTSAILRNYPKLASAVTFVSEAVPYLQMQDDFKPKYAKFIYFIFSKEMLIKEHASVKSDLEQLLLTITKEIELIQQDNLARGQIVQSVDTTAFGKEKENNISWEISSKPLLTNVEEQDPPEFWGNLSFRQTDDIISATPQYPWMPENISGEELPF